jgi:endonuclease YncB( thermonuclease family)
MRFNAISLVILVLASLSACGGGGGSTSTTPSTYTTSSTATTTTATTSVTANTLQVPVLRVHDGDTLTVLDAAKQEMHIRFSGIDAPETDQAYGSASGQNVSSLVLGKTVGVHWDKVDMYGRYVGIITLNGQDINLLQIERGLAWHYKAYASEQTPQNAALYAAAETKARAAKVGLWADAAPMAPWDWRKQGAVTPTTTPTPSTPGTTPVCYTGPNGGTYTLTAAGNKNYEGC